MLVETFAVGPLGCNCSIVVDPASREAIVVDPGGDFDAIRARVEELGAKVGAIVHTHTHIDHVGATAPLQRWTGATASIHEADRFLYDMLPVQAAMIGCAMPERCEMAGDLLDDRTVEAGSLAMQVLHTPGHTPGSCSFVVRDGARSVAFTGDTLFKQGIGRSDLWGGDFDTIARSLRDRVLALGDDVEVVAGHGPGTTIGDERRSNPWLRRIAR